MSTWACSAGPAPPCPSSGSSSRAPASPPWPSAVPRAPTREDRATSVPVTVWDPPAWLDTLEAGEEIVVVGRLRRRFYQRPGGVGSRVDVEAEYIARARDRRRIDAALRRALAALEALG